MALFNWIDKQDGIDDVLAEDINEIAHAVRENSKNVENLSKDKANINDVPTKVSELENDSGYITKEDIKGKDENKILEYLTYEIFDGKVTITDCDTSISGSHIIPDMIEGYLVTAIGTSAFSGCNLLESITIPDGVIEMGNQVFYNCTTLSNIILSERITTIPNGAFTSCTSLSQIKIPKSVTLIDGFAFLNTGFNPATVAKYGKVYYDGTQEQWNEINIGKGNDKLINSKLYFGNMYETYSKTETDELLSIKADKPQYVMFSDGDTITLVDNTTYYTEGTISNLTIIYPSESFICSLEFTLASDGDITITLPESKYIGGTPTFANGETWELNIKNGVVVGGLIE